jgi:hypothetical protein
MTPANWSVVGPQSALKRFAVGCHVALAGSEWHYLRELRYERIAKWLTLNGIKVCVGWNLQKCGEARQMRT